jgi:hypothetical protein
MFPPLETHTKRQRSCFFDTTFDASPYIHYESSHKSGRLQPLGRELCIPRELLLGELLGT